MHSIRQLRPELRRYLGLRELLSGAWLARALLGLAAALSLVGCGDDDDDDDSPKGECFKYEGWDGASPKVVASVELFGDLQSDPDGGPAHGGIIRRACALSTCHGSETKPDGTIYLGPPLRDTAQQPIAITPDDIATVLANLIDFSSKTAPTIARVARNDPENSFLMIKVDGCRDPVKAQCTTPQAGRKGDHPCGDLMPQTGGLLKAEERNTIRRWIAQGASGD